MQRKLCLSTFQIGSPVKKGQGLRIGTSRRPPHGVPRERWTADGHFDVWLPAVAPSPKLIARFKGRNFDDCEIRAAYLDSYEREVLRKADGRQTIELLANIAQRMPVSVGCFCGDEAKCHRSRLDKMIRRRAMAD